MMISNLVEGATGLSRVTGYTCSFVVGRTKVPRRLIWNSNGVVSHPSAMKLPKNGAHMFIRKERADYP